MKLVIILLSTSLVFAFEEPYQGFDDCGVDGWSCAHTSGKYEITYTCPRNRPGARVWVWTARLPPGASTFIVRDCAHLEVHFDCTRGLRSHILRKFRVINVTSLDVLPPMVPSAFLHDNDQVLQSPSILHISNVKKIKFFPGLFEKPVGECKYKFVELSSLTLENVRIDRLMKDLFASQNMDSLIMKNVVIDAIDSNAMTAAANISITETTFPAIPVNGINFRGESISFINNTFRKLQTNAVTIKGRELRFSNNYVEDIGTQGLDVQGSDIQITNNNFYHLDTGAFEKISPGHSFMYVIASRFIYNFSGNSVKHINPGSIHLNWEDYKKVCSEIILKNNLFDCSCVNLGWVSVANGLGPKISKVKDFYDTYFSKGDNLCQGFDHCSLTAVIAQIQDVCNNKTNISTICSSTKTQTESATESFQDDVTDATSFNHTKVTTDDQDFLTSRTQIVEKIIPVLSYAENQTSHIKSRDLPIWFIVLPVLLILAAVGTGVFVWWYKRKKQRQVITTMYKNERGFDSDSLIIEHHNELYDKQ